MFSVDNEQYVIVGFQKCFYSPTDPLWQHRVELKAHALN